MMRLYVAALAGNLGMVSIGLFFGWASPSLPLLMEKDSPVELSFDQIGWVVSLFTLGGAIGSVMSAFVVNIIGRKRTMLLTAVPAIIGWLMIAFATTPGELCGSRFISGLSSGIAYSVTPMYLGEISPPKVRGILVSMVTVAAKFGAVFEYAIGPFLSVRNLALISLVVPILFVIAFIWLPETPYHLIRHGRREEAVEALIQFRGKNDVSEEIEAIEKSVKIDLLNETGFREILFVPGNRRALIISLGLMLTQQWSGSQVIVSYAQMILDQADSGLEGKYMTIVLGVVQVIFTMFSMSIVDRGGRKPLLILSSIGTAISTFMIGIYFYLQRDTDLEDTANSLGWLPATGAILYIIMYCCGLAALPFTMIGELFPTNVKALGSTMSIFTCNISAFVATQSYTFVSADLGNHVAFWFFSAMSIIGAVFTIFYVPETKGKTLQEIQNELHGAR